jgi:two-component system chemotaxis response regulator CheB
MATIKTRDAPIRALVIDDSPTARELLVSILQIAEGIQVVGTGATGEDAVRLVHRMKPNVLVMDINMPVLDGLEATRHIMETLPVPIVLVTGTFMHTDLDLSFKALKAGALTVLAKPGMADVEACDQVVRTVRDMAHVPVVRRWGDKHKQRKPRSSPPPTRAPASTSTTARSATAAAATASAATAMRRDLTLPVDEDELRRIRLVGIAASTGGPGALAKILKPLPADFSRPILVVQHVTNGFATGFAEWLDGETALQVKLASHGEEPQAGTVLVAPDDYHLLVNFMGVVELHKTEPYHGLRPAANNLFHSLARIYGRRALGIIMTGMGDDGADGMAALHEAGGLTLAQDKASCVVYGMPNEAVLRNAVDAVFSLEDLAATLLKLANL